jgi:hypothetical protein
VRVDDEAVASRGTRGVVAERAEEAVEPDLEAADERTHLVAERGERVDLPDDVDAHCAGRDAQAGELLRDRSRGRGALHADDDAVGGLVDVGRHDAGELEQRVRPLLPGLQLVERVVSAEEANAARRSGLRAEDDLDRPPRSRSLRLVDEVDVQRIVPQEHAAEAGSGPPDVAESVVDRLARCGPRRRPCLRGASDGGGEQGEPDDDSERDEKPA